MQASINSAGPATASAATGTALVCRPSPAPVALTPAPVIDDTERALLGPELALARDLAANALAKSTRDNYASHWYAFEAWCDSRNVSSLPAAPETVAQYVASLAVAISNDGEAIRDAEGQYVRGSLRPGSIEVHLAAINKVHCAARLPKPGADPQVTAVMAGIRRTFKMSRDNAKAALDLPLLERVLAAVAQTPATVALDRALVLLAGQGAGPGVLARLDWTRVVLTADSVEVVLPSPRRGERGERHLSMGATLDPAVCPVRAFRALEREFGASGPVFPNIGGDGGAMTKQGLSKRLVRLAGPVGGVWDPARAEEACRRMVALNRRQIRDLALLETGWICALRRSNLTAMNWGHTEVYDDAVRIVLTWQKNDQDGSSGHVVWLTRTERPGQICPYNAFIAWRDVVADVLGGDPAVLASDQPVFTPIDRSDRLRRSSTGRLQRLDGDSINAIVQDHCAAAGLDPTRYGAHSLRAGFVTEAFKNDLSIVEVQQVTGHKDLSVLASYNRAVQTRKNNPAKKLLERASQKGA